MSVKKLSVKKIKAIKGGTGNSCTHSSTANEKTGRPTNGCNPN